MAFAHTQGGQVKSSTEKFFAPIGKEGRKVVSVDMSVIACVPSNAFSLEMLIVILELSSILTATFKI